MTASNRASFSCFEGSDASLFSTAMHLQRCLPDFASFYSQANFDATRGNKIGCFPVNPFQTAPRSAVRGIAVAARITCESAPRKRTAPSRA